MPTAPVVPVLAPDAVAGHASVSSSGSGDAGADVFAALVAGLLAPAAGSTAAGLGEEPGAPAAPAEEAATDGPTAPVVVPPAALPVWPLLVDRPVAVQTDDVPAPGAAGGPAPTSGPPVAGAVYDASSRAAAIPAAPGSPAAPGHIAAPATPEAPVAPTTPGALAAPAAPVAPASQVTRPAAVAPAGLPAQAARTALAAPVAPEAAVDPASPAAPEQTADPTHPAAESRDTTASGSVTGAAATSPSPGADPAVPAAAPAPVPAPASPPGAMTDPVTGLTTGPVTGPAAVAAPTAVVAPTAPEGARTGPVVAQVVPEVTRMVSRGDGVHRLTMRLQPEALGAVRVTLTVRDGEVHVQLAAGEDARRALAEGAPELRRVLELAGASDARVVVRDLAGTAVGPLAPSTPGGSAGPLDQSPGPHAGTGGDASQPGTGRGEQDQRARTRGGAPAMDGLIDGANPLRPDPVGGAPRGIDLTM
ncbi:hypothetical protein ASG94_09055 [Nocardioides sp. Soil805]|nr:hypothetical protein ASG94_09055 [Nocardioides sp. Soil805]